MSRFGSFQPPTSLEECRSLDAEDGLASKRELFDLPDDLIYLDGNSLGPLSKSVPRQIDATIRDAWGNGLIRSWNDAGWYEAPRRIGRQIARLIGAQDHEVVVTDSTSVNLYKLLVAAMRLRPGRNQILVDRDGFPTDLYIADSVACQLGGSVIGVADADQVTQSMDNQTAVACLSHVDYKTARMHDLHAVTQAVHEAGALVIWDLAHSAGAMQVDLAGAQADFAVGCGYKYLNGGPGAPSYLFVRRDLIQQVSQPLSGWFAHRSPFEFESEFSPAEDIGRMLCGTPPILSLIALEASLQVWNDVELDAIRIKSCQLSETMIELVTQRCPDSGIELLSPRDPHVRGSHVAFGHRDGYAIVQALIARGIIGDFREPDLMRFGVSPLYNRFEEMWWFAHHLGEIIDQEVWRDDRFQSRNQVT